MHKAKTKITFEHYFELQPLGTDRMKPDFMAVMRHANLIQHVSTGRRYVARGQRLETIEYRLGTGGQAADESGGCSICVHLYPAVASLVSRDPP